MDMNPADFQNEQLDRDQKISRTANDPELRYKYWQLLATYLSLIVAVVGIGFVVWSVRNNTKSVSTGVQQHAMSLVTDLDKVFIDHPQLYPYFYECKELELDPNDKESKRVVAAAMMMLDVLDMAAMQSTENKLDWGDPEAWDRWIFDQFVRSPILRKTLKEHEGWYGKRLKTKRDEAERELEKMRRENKSPCV